MRGYRPELDGLRAVAILLVLIAHSAPGDAMAFGRAGVTTFFVLSGYLITSLLTRDGNTIQLREFYRRRFVRLAPAFVVLVLFVGAVGVAGGWRGPWLPGVAWSLGYSANWGVLCLYDLGPMLHAWTLSIEEQFYLLWPLALLLLPKRALLVALGTAVVGGVLTVGLQGPVAYFSTPTNAMAISAGCALALRPVALPRWAVLPGLLVIVAAVVADSTFPATIGACLILCSGSLALAPLASLGRRAYSLYLWNWPLSLLLPVALVIPATLGAAELSYRFVEQPMLRRFGSPARSNTGTAIGSAPRATAAAA